MGVEEEAEHRSTVQSQKLSEGHSNADPQNLHYYQVKHISSVSHIQLSTAGRIQIA